MPTEPPPLTLAEAVRTAVEICDDGTSDGLDDLLTRFEDADEPISAVGDIQARLDEALGPPDADELDAPLTMARAVVSYLAYRRDAIDNAPDELLRLAARAEFEGNPPEHVAEWLELQVSLMPEAAHGPFPCTTRRVMLRDVPWAAGTPVKVPNVHPACRNVPRIGDDGFEELCHIVSEADPDTALCGKDVTGYPWNPPWPRCEACMAVIREEMN